VQPDDSGAHADQPPLFAEFTDAMLRQLGVPHNEIASIRSLTDPNALECMTLLQRLAETQPNVADVLLAFATGNSATRQAVLDLAMGSATLSDVFPEQATSRLGGMSEEFITFEDPAELQDVLERGTLEQWQLFLHPDQRSLVQRSFSGPARLRGISGSGKTVVDCIALVSSKGRGSKGREGPIDVVAARRIAFSITESLARTRGGKVGGGAALHRAGQGA
jgi:hypothetical protein